MCFKVWGLVFGVSGFKVERFLGSNAGFCV